MIDFAKELNQEQLAVVYMGDGPCLVLAGAGSGKTRTITYRVAYLLEQGVAPENILLVTFTNKAAGEMVKRVRDLTGAENNLPWAGTFHSIANKILRHHANALGYQNNFTILDEDDAEALIKIAVKNNRSDDDGKKFPSASAIKNIFSFTRNAERPLHEVLEIKNYLWLDYLPELERVRADYERAKKEANAMDFDDLLVNLLLLLQMPDIQRKYANQFKYILVDEYQDTNKLQASVISLLSSVHGNVLAVGDDAQSIYSFRAADVKNILNFEKIYPGAKIFKLETNYRSSQEILDVANCVIANNVRQYQKELKTIFSGGAKPIVYSMIDQIMEAKFVADEVAKQTEGDTPAKEIAVLFRASHHSQQLELELMRRGLSYDYRGGLRFFERAHVKDALAYLRLIHNPADTSAWLRALLHEEGIGPAGAMKIIENFKNGFICHPREGGDPDAGVRDDGKRLDSRLRGNDTERVGSALSPKAQTGWNNFLKIHDSLVQAGDQPANLMRAVLESSYRDYLEKEYLDAAERVADLEQMITFAEQYDSLEKFLAETTLAENYNLKNSGHKNYGDKIILSTIHQAKGLEWQTVFVINMASGAFPNDRALREDGGLEEERRLFYVAITRAKKNLFLTYPLSGSAQGRPASGWGSVSGPSMFVDEIHPDLIEDRSTLSSARSTAFNDSDITYVSEDEEYAPKKISPGSFLRDIDDL
jgi:DNA helicase-2/ATP-dependent DNA helicase PcrA